MMNVALPLLLLGVAWRGKSMASIYQAEVAAELSKHSACSPGMITEDDLAGLPPPVQRYFRASGFVGKPHTVNMKVIWREMQLKRSRDAEWMKLSCQQLNSIPEPMRIAFMQGRIAGVIPFEGRDKYQDGHGNMLIKLMKVITLGESKGTYMAAGQCLKPEEKGLCLVDQRDEHCGNELLASGTPAFDPCSRPHEQLEGTLQRWRLGEGGRRERPTLDVVMVHVKPQGAPRREGRADALKSGPANRGP